MLFHAFSSIISIYVQWKTRIFPSRRANIFIARFTNCFFLYITIFFISISYACNVRQQFPESISRLSRSLCANACDKSPVVTSELSQRFWLACSSECERDVNYLSSAALSFKPRLTNLSVVCVAVDRIAGRLTKSGKIKDGGGGRDRGANAARDETCSLPALSPEYRILVQSRGETIYPDKTRLVPVGPSVCLSACLFPVFSLFPRAPRVRRRTYRLTQEQLVEVALSADEDAVVYVQLEEATR